MTHTAPVNHRILVIDDNVSIHDDFRKILCPNDANPALDAQHRLLLSKCEPPAPTIRYHIDSAYRGEEGVDMIAESLREERPYSLAFVDMHMQPGMDGMEAAERMWELDPGLQIVVCTACSDHQWKDVQHRLRRPDQMLILKKPFDNIEVVQLACAMTGKWNLARQARLKFDELEAMVDSRTQALKETNDRLQSEIADRQSAEDRLRHDALHDSLTELPNRGLFLDRLNQCQARRQRNSGYHYAVLFLDIDNFKVINDSLGHNAGDELLVKVARRLTKCLRCLDSVSRNKAQSAARLGGDEFVILLDDLRRPRDAPLVADRIQDALAEPFQLAGQPVTISASIGIAIADEKYSSGSDLLRNADTAMYRAKLAGKAQHALFDETMYAEVARRLQLENDLRWALEEQQFELVFQPIIRLNTGRITAFESLVRWNHPERGVIPPTDFIPVAEEVGLIVPLGRWVLEESCRIVNEWNAARIGAPPIAISVNVSKRQVSEPDFVDMTRQILEQYSTPGHALKMEITESVIMDNPDSIVDVLDRIKELGIELYMDDFGTGQSSLSCLHQFPLDVLKIDRKFIATMESNRDYAAIVDAIITLAHNLNMRVTAEGIETEEQFVQMIDLDCDYGQGYFMSRPLPADQALEMIRSGWILTRAA